MICNNLTNIFQIILCRTTMPILEGFNRQIQVYLVYKTPNLLLEEHKDLRHILLSLKQEILKFQRSIHQESLEK